MRLYNMSEIYKRNNNNMHIIKLCFYYFKILEALIHHIYYLNGNYLNSFQRYTRPSLVGVF